VLLSRPKWRSHHRRSGGGAQRARVFKETARSADITDLPGSKVYYCFDGFDGNESVLTMTQLSCMCSKCAERVAVDPHVAATEDDFECVNENCPGFFTRAERITPTSAAAGTSKVVTEATKMRKARARSLLGGARARAGDYVLIYVHDLYNSREDTLVT
jgi:hypothetical protein